MNPNHHAVEAEQSVLGGILIEPQAYFQVADIIGPGDFVLTAHGILFQAMADMHKAQRPIDVITVAEWLRGIRRLAECGDTVYLIELASNTPGAANIRAWAELVAKASEMRRLQTAALAIQNCEGYGEALAILNAVRPKQAASLTGAKAAAKAMYEGVVARYDAPEGRLGMPTTIDGLDALLGGLEKGKAYWFAARPGMGKTTYGVQLGTRGGRCLFFSFEMTAASLISRATANIGMFPHRWLRFPKEVESEPLWEGVLVKAISEVAKLRLVIDDTPRLTVEELVSRAKQAHMIEPLDLVVIDHFGWIKLPGKGRNDVELGDASKALKAMAKDLDIPVVILYQLNRGVTERVDKEPNLQDLRGSGQIEEDADAVVFLHRPEYYKQEPAGYVKFIVAKGRDSETGFAWAKARLSHMRMESCDAPETDVFSAGSQPRDTSRPTGSFSGKRK